MSDLETEMRGNAGEGVCFIFDGLDEYTLRSIQMMAVHGLSSF